MADTPLLLHIKRVAELLGISQYQVRGLVTEGTLPSTRIKNRTYVPAEAVRTYVEQHAERAAS